jgi:two-component system, cell cycle sensor histidine kinase and response regulator CckA
MRESDCCRSLFKNSKLPFLVFDLHTLRVLAANKAAEQLCGYSRREFKSLSMRDFLAPDDLAALLGPPPESSRATPVSITVRINKKDGHQCLANIVASEVNQGDGNVTLLFTQKHSASPNERTLEYEHKFTTAFNCCPIATAIVERNSWRYLEVNDAFLRLVGWEKDEVIGSTHDDLNLWPNTEIQTRLVRDLNQQGRISGLEAKCQPRKGKDRVVRLFAECMEVNGVPCVLLIYNDITDTKSVEEQLHQAQKMEAVGRLAGGVAHDFNNVLGVIIGYCDLILQQSASMDSALQSVERIRRAAERAAGLTRRILAFSRQRLVHPRSIELNALINDLSVMLRRLISEDVELVLRLDQGLGGMQADPSQIEQLIMNLAINAHDAMPEGGKLIIQTANFTVDGQYSRQVPDVKPGSYVMLQVSDTGWGINPDILPHIFEPFFTTKVPGKGTGLGLAIVYGVVKQSDGNIWVYSDSGKGTTFKILFPRIAVAAKQAVPSLARRLKATGSETVLLVEDDESLREVTRRVLETSGYTVIESPSSKRAVNIAATYKGTIDLLLTDIVMPGMSGIQLATILTTHDPNLRVLYTSGYAGEFVAESPSDDISFLEKPYSQGALLREVRGVLDNKRYNARKRQAGTRRRAAHS